MSKKLLKSASLFFFLWWFSDPLIADENGVKNAAIYLTSEINKYGSNALTGKVQFIMGEFTFATHGREIRQNGFPEYLKQMVLSEFLNHPSNYLRLVKDGTTNNLSLSILMPKNDLLQLFPVLCLDEEMITFEVINLKVKDVPKLVRPTLNTEIVPNEYELIPNVWPSPNQEIRNIKKPISRRSIWKKVWVFSLATGSIAGFILYYAN